MGKIKGWSKVAVSPSVWRSDRNGSLVSIERISPIDVLAFFQPFGTSRMKPKIITNFHRRVVDAEKAAIKWMRRHPNG